MPYGWIDEWVFSYDGRYVTRLWDCDEESMEDGYYGSRSEIDRGQIWIATGYGWMTGGGLLEVDDRRWITGDG
jgi:hypothetical protein